MRCRTALLIILLLIILILTTACSGNKKIEGTWVYDIGEGVGITYIFNKNGTGNLIFLNEITELTYEIRGNKINIHQTVNGELEIVKRTFTVSENKLILSTGTGIEMIFIKQK